MSRRRAPRSVLLAALLAAALVVTAGLALAGGVPSDGRIGPARRLLGSGRLLTPEGRLTTLGNFPTGAAATPDGRFYWTVSAGRGPNDVRIVSVATGRVIQTLSVPGASGGIVMNPVRRLAYVSGVALAGSAKAGSGAAGRYGDVIRVYSYGRGGNAALRRRIPVPPPGDAPTLQNFPRSGGQARISWPDRLAVSADGRTLLVSLNLADSAAVVGLESGARRYVHTGSHPHGAAILRDGHTGLVANEGEGTVSVIDLAGATVRRRIVVGAHDSHPGAVLADPKLDRAYVVLTNSDEVAVIDTRRGRVMRRLSIRRPEGAGSAPVDLALTPAGDRMVVAEAGADELSVFALPGARRGAAARPAFSLVGRIPVADYPTDVSIVPAGDATCTAPPCSTLLWTAARGLGTGANPRGPSPYRQAPADLGQYLPQFVYGRAGILPFPADRDLHAASARATRQLRPANTQEPPADTPLRPGGPIDHAFFIVRENRTYDQVLGDDPRGDGSPGLTLFGRAVTPNAHALAERFPLLDHVYANSEASIDGHAWTTAAAVSDYTQRNWFQNYAGRGRPTDFSYYSISWAPQGFLFDQAERQGISYQNFGEVLAGVVEVPDRDRSLAQRAALRRRAAHSDIGRPPGCYPSNAFVAKDPYTRDPAWDSSPPPGAGPNVESRFDCFRQKFLSEVATDSVPRLTYMVLPADHTRGLAPGARSPRAMIAENDYALGQVVDLISHSPEWARSAIFVVEDDSQNGADHVDAHRIPAFAISPYAKPGAVVHTRYDFLSVIHSIELILGMESLGLADRLGVPMYDAFDSTPTNSQPFEALDPTFPLLDTNPTSGAQARAAARLDLSRPDQVPQVVLDAMLWRSVHGARSRPPRPPAPGPNAVAGG